MTWHIGVDGGGTRARAVLVDGMGAVIDRAEGPAGIVRPGDPHAAAAVVAELARVLLSGRADRATTLCCGLAGAGRAAERDIVQAALQAEGVADAVVVTGDAEAAMIDAFGPRAGVLLIAGTGSIAWAADGNGGALRVGGWGYLLGDEGSGYAIGLAGLRAVARADDGRAPETALTEVLLSAAQLGSAEDLVRFAGRATKGDIAAMTPHVLQCAARGDAAAVRIRAEAVEALAELAATAAARAGLVAPVCALAGGLIQPGGPLREPVADALLRRLPHASVAAGSVDAARGAARIGMQAQRPHSRG